MKLNKRLMAIIAAVVILGGALVGGLILVEAPLAVFAGESDDALEDEAEGEELPITGEALEQASEAALQYARESGLGEGRVTDTEVGDEEGNYEVELTLEDGREVDIHLDEDFNVLGDEVEDEEEDED